MKPFAVLILLSFLFSSVLVAQSSQSLCPNVLRLLSIETDSSARKPPRVEVRRCGVDRGEGLQILAWQAGTRAAPILVIDTHGFGVVQTFSRDNIFLIETANGARNRVFVIQYESGTPKLVVNQVTKGTAEVAASEKYVVVTITGIWAGDAPPRTESHTFLLDFRQMERSEK